MRRRDFLLASGVTAAACGLGGIDLRAVAQQGGVMVWGGNLPLQIDPHTILDVPSTFTKANVYDSLYTYVGIEPTPLLVTTHTVSSDSRTWEFTLRDDVKFHDGTRLTADDVVYSFQRVLKLNLQPAATFVSFLNAAGVTATAPNKVRFELKEVYAPFLTTLPLVPIVNKALVERNVKDGDNGTAWLNQNDAGSGPYKIVSNSFVPNQKLDMEWFPDYFRGWVSPVPVQQVRVRPILDDATRVLAVEKGEIDATHGYVPADQHKRVREAPGVFLSVEPTFRICMVRMHNGRAPFNNINFRKAVAYAFPYDVFIEKVLLGTVERNPGPLPSSLWGAPADLKGYSYDPKKAREHLDLAKKDGVDLNREIDFLSLVGFGETEQIAQLMQAELRKLGIKMKISKTPWSNALQLTQKEETSPDIWAHWATSYFIDPDNWTGTFYSTKNLGTQRGSSWYRNPEMDRILNAARSTFDRPERTKLYEQASRILVDDCVDLWVYNGKTFRAVRKRLKGYEPATGGDGIDIRKIQLES